jgi:Tol biopolymer transport system component
MVWWNWRRTTACGAVVLAATTLTGCAQTWQTELVSRNAAGTDSATGHSGDGPLSFTPDGTKVVFVTSAGDLGPTDTNGRADVYIRDLTTGTATLVSVNAAGTDAGDGASEVAKLSADGTKVAFRSGATDLLPTPTRPGAIYVRDLVAGTTTLATPNAAGTDAADGWINDFELSPDGTKVLWPTNADDLGPNDHDRPPYDHGTVTDDDDMDVYVHDLVAGTTSLVSVNAAGTDSADTRTDAAWFNADGTKVQFSSAATDLVPGDTNGRADAFERDLATGVTTRIELSPTASTIPRSSADGSVIAFQTTSNDLGPTDSDCSATLPPFPPMTRACSDVYVRDVATGATSLVSANAAGTDSADGDSTLLGLSPDGTKVLFESWAGDLGPADAGYDLDLYLHDRTTGTTTLVTVSADGTDGLDSGNVAIYHATSPDWTKVAFGTMATNLGPTDTNGTFDVYVRDLAAGTTTLVSHTRSSATTTGDGTSLPGSFSPDGRKLVYRSRATDLVATDTNGRLDVFVASLPAPPPG